MTVCKNSISAGRAGAARLAQNKDEELVGHESDEIQLCMNSTSSTNSTMYAQN